MHKKQTVYELPITTPNGDTSISVQHTVINENDEAIQATISVILQGQKRSFTALTTAEALMEFAKYLPSGWSIKSCLSCRYGHFCPVGNADNELFCVTEFEPKEISDLWHVTEDDDERQKRSRTLFFRCDHYRPQSNDYFTYSDFFLT